MTTDNRVFISYRRSVSSFIARAIFIDLKQHGYDVFMDVESVTSGQFDNISLNQIAARTHFLVILTPGSVEPFTDPNDWLRQEIEHAIELQRNIVPVLVNGFTFKPYLEYFTGKLATLQRASGLVLYPDYFDAGMQRLRQRLLQDVPDTGMLTTPPEERQIVAQKIQQAESQPLPTPVQLTAEELFERGLEHFGLHEYAKAIVAFDRCLRAFPRFAPGYVMRGSAKGQIDDIQGAIDDLVHYLAMNDDYNFVDRTGVVRMINSLKDRKPKIGEIA